LEFAIEGVVFDRAVRIGLHLPVHRVHSLAVGLSLFLVAQDRDSEVLRCGPCALPWMRGQGTRFDFAFHDAVRHLGPTELQDDVGGGPCE